MENIFYFKHCILNTPCPPSPEARLRDFKTIFYNLFFKFIAHQAFSHVQSGVVLATALPWLEQLEGWIQGSLAQGDTQGDIS